MEKDLNDSVVENSSCLKDSETDKSFVGKFKSIINNTPLSKWFRKQDVNRSTIRRRDEIFEDEDICEMQPPSKRVKLPGGNEESNCNILFNETRNAPITNNINVTNKTFNSFSEPVAGPSGIKSRKLLSNTTTASTSSVRNTFSSNELLNGHKDSDSEESTSGYSSVARIGSKEQVCGSQESSKQTSPLQNSPSNSRSLFHTSNASTTRSLFAERSLSPNMNTSLSSRRPSFNASTFGSPNFVDKTISTKRIINSPFYNGQTIYGGASAYGRKLGRSSQDLKKSLRNSVQIKPVNKTAENGDLVLGKTARRILDTLEQYSSPINDAKKIPLVSKKFRHDGLLTKYTGANPYMVRESKITSNKELQVPSVSDLLKMKHKTRLQDSTEAVRKIATSSKSDLNSEYYNINVNENEKEKHTGKMKTKIASVRQKQPSNETINDVNLNPVSLPITTLPKFDFIIPSPDQAKKVPENPTQPIKQVPSSPTSGSANAQPSWKIIETEKNVQIEKQTTTSTIIEYKFSDPLVVAENMKSIVAINDFKFSEPHCKKSRTDASSNVNLNFKMPENKLPSLLPNKMKNKIETSVKTPTILKTGSVMDILGKKDNSLMEKFKPAEGTWECSSCMIRNQSDKTKCVACETPKLVPTTQAENREGFGNQFKLSSDKWECSSCMVRNNNSDSKCVACTAFKPNTISTPKDVDAKSVPPLSGFGDKFKPSSDYWKCTVCLIQNKAELTKCAACENPKLTTAEPPSSNFGDKFKSPPNSWECTSCLVRNKEEAIKCIACETPKSGQKSLKSSGFGDSFKVKDDEWECGVCMVRNKKTNTKCQCCDVAKPGKSATTKSSALETTNDKKPIPTFNFGIDKAAAASFNFGIPSTAATSLIKTDTNASSIFGQSAAVTTAAPAAFSFGIPPQSEDKPKANEPAKLTEPAKTPALQIQNSVPKTVEKQSEKSEPTQSGFKFEVGTPTVPVNNKEVTVQKSDTIALSTSSSDAPKPTFNFKPTTANGDINKSGLFGSKPETTSGTSFNPTTVGSANLFNFGAKPTATATPLASTPATQSSQTVSAKPLFNFGSNSHSTVKSSTPSFSSVNPSVTSLNNGFATTNTPSFGTTSTSSFETPITNSSEVKPFTFTTATTSGEPANKASMFSFGQSAGPAATTAPTKTTGFNFNSTSTPAFNFTGGKTETPSFNAPANNMFGVVASNSGKNGTFNFGSMASSNNNQKAGFSFGAAINNTTAPPTQPSFGFGGTAATVTPAPSSGGFNFTGAPPTFNAAAKPSFNFTDGTTTAFSAPPSTDGGLAVAPRKIKRAVRRTQR